MKAWKWLLLALLTMALCAWMALILSQRNVPLMLVAFFGLVWLALLATRRRSFAKGWKLWAMGAFAGYIGTVFAAAVGELAMRGADFFERSFVNNLYFFPTFSFGWLYGAFAFWLASDRAASSIEAADQAHG
jgi:hypothetical protein